MKINNERQFEAYIRRLISTNITSRNPKIYVLKNKKAVDIVICRDGRKPALFFIEVKFYDPKHGRLGFGGQNGGGFQPEIVERKPRYFEHNLRWVLASKVDQPGKLIFAPTSTIRKYIAGGSLGKKHNNIQKRIFQEQKWLGTDEFVAGLRSWLLAN